VIRLSPEGIAILKAAGDAWRDRKRRSRDIKRRLDAEGLKRWYEEMAPIDLTMGHLMRAALAAGVGITALRQATARGYGEVEKFIELAARHANAASAE
jgi:hypothetical protein